MNDVVVKFRITEMLLASHVENIQITGDLAAYGASYKNGFAIRLPGVTGMLTLLLSLPSSLKTLAGHRRPMSTPRRKG